MAEYSSDEERFSAFVNFFKDHKNSLVIGFLLLTFILISSVSYKSYSSSQNLKAGEIYDAWFVGLTNDSASTSDNKEDFDKLQEKYSNTGYAQLARMIRGSSFARDGDLDAALVDFQQLLDATSGFFGNDMLNSIAKINIARIELSKQNYSSALAVLESFNSESEHPLVYEVKGDALAGLEKKDLALDQYSLALENSQNESQKSLLQMKINKITN
ncbi:tetratricopeptide repeat protein [Gammaproteobacteria bacterium]|nr:tetratricopeptide repeat protein [Gammaproteobacteria bacterium]MDC3228529.1 tetratricopeptide repeat protein [Gammaproteobacteria bacterium]